MVALRHIARRADAFCASLNAGLCAVAMALALITAVTWAGQHPEIFQMHDDALVAAAGDQTAF
jgi:hypothetical protein